MKNRLEKLEAVASAANDILEDVSCNTPKLARLALALHALGGDYEIKGREQCSCGTRDCDECADTDQIIAALQATIDGRLAPRI